MAVALAIFSLPGCRPDAISPPEGGPATEDHPARAQVVAREIHRGRFACIPAPANNADGFPVTCEPSGVTRRGDALWIANDKPLPGASPMMRSRWTGDALAPITYANAPLLARARKLEDLAAIPGAQGLLAITGFDRIDPDDARSDVYNMLLVWTPGQAAQIVEPRTRDGVRSSASMRAGIREALADDAFPQGPPYFKVEGLALLPEGRLLLGVREQGDSWKTPRFVVRILETRWSADTPTTLAGTLRLAWSFDPTTVPEIPQAIGLSGLAWDGAHDRLLLLTSYELGETDADLGAYLWTLPRSDYERGAAPTLVRAEDGAPFHMDHKAEALTPLDGDRVLVVHDDDRVTGGAFERALHEADYAVLSVSLSSQP